MSVERFSSVIPSSTQVLASVSDWGSRLVAPLGSSLMSKDGMIELARRTYWIVGLLIAAVIVARKCGYLMGRITPTDSSSNDPIKEIGELRQESSKIKQLIQQLRQRHQQIEQMRAQYGQLKMRVQEQPGQQLEEQRIELLERLVPLLEQNIQLEEQIKQRVAQLEQRIK